MYNRLRHVLAWSVYTCIGKWVHVIAVVLTSPFGPFRMELVVPTTLLPPDDNHVFRWCPFFASPKCICRLPLLLLRFRFGSLSFAPPCGAGLVRWSHLSNSIVIASRWVMDWEEIEEDRVAMVLAGPNLICCYTNNRETGGRGASRWLKYCGVLERQFVRNNLNGFAWLPGVNIEISREWKSISHMFSSQIFIRIRNRTVCLECVHQQQLMHILRARGEGTDDVIYLYLLDLTS